MTSETDNAGHPQEADREQPVDDRELALQAIKNLLRYPRLSEEGRRHLELLKKKVTRF